MDQDLDPSGLQIESHHDLAWQAIKSYWQSAQRFPVYVFFTIVTVVTVFLVTLDLIFNYWYYNYFYYALQAYDKHGIVQLVALFFMLTGCYLVLGIHRYFAAQLIGRRWLSHQFVSRLLQKHERHRLRKMDARVAEEMRTLINFSVDLSMNVVVLITTFAAFMYYLCQLSDDMTLHLGKIGVWQVPGYLVWVGILYGIIGTFFILKRGRWKWRARAWEQNESRHFVQAQYETSVKSGLMVWREKILLWFLAGYSVVYIVLSLVITLPDFIDKIYLIGVLAQSFQAFMCGQNSLSFLLHSHAKSKSSEE